jgi:DNA polymerase III epsilon subunit family exonuclease
MKPSFKYWLFILAIACAIFGVILASVFASWFNLEPHEQAYLAGMADRILPFPLLGAFILFLVIGGMVSLLFRYYIIPIMRMAESTQLISLSNPDHRLPTTGAQEVAHLAAIINASADAYQKLQLEVETSAYEAKADLLEERNRFAALMSELPAGVLVCNIHGQILLYNKQAQMLLQASAHDKFTGLAGCNEGWIGLGRSLFGVIPREPVAAGIERLQQAVAAGLPDLTARFAVERGDRSPLNVSMAPVFSFRCGQHDECVLCDRRNMSGLVLTIDDTSVKQVEAADGPRRLPDRTGEEAVITASQSPARESRPTFYEFDLFHNHPPGEMGEQPLRRLTCVAFDTETTGLDPAAGDEIVQLGAVRIVNGKLIREELIDQLIDPQRPIPEASSAIHGITEKMVSGQPTIDQVLPHFRHFVEGAALVAHNAAFDMRCLQLKESRTGVRFDNPVLDTLLLSSILHPHQESHSLDEIAARLNLTNLGRHTALGDAIVTAEVLLKMIPLLEAMGIVTLNDALKASARSPFATLSY